MLESLSKNFLNLEDSNQAIKYSQIDDHFYDQIFHIEERRKA